MKVDEKKIDEKKKSQWQVVVGNVGTVYEGTNGFEARKTYVEYVKISKDGYGRAGGEDVALMRDGDIDKEFTGAISQQERAEEEV